MDHIKLPISKSIANRILLLQAIHGDPLMRVSSDTPDDVLVLHDALEQLREHKTGAPLTLYLKNCGTALRFLQVHLEYCYKGEPIVLGGDPRLMERDGKPTTQTTSALILHGEDIPVSENESPYITMSRRIKEQYEEQNSRPSLPPPKGGLREALEPDWSSAAFWYEYVAIHGGELLLEGLTSDSLQGDRVVADIYAQHFGVQTEFVPEGALIHHTSNIKHQTSLSLNFERIPDLYPAVALTCEKLSIDLIASGIENLRHKESDRIEAVRLHEVRNDHRMAMALLAADFTVAESEQSCIAKSYPQFTAQLTVFTSQSRDLLATCPRPDCKVTTPLVTHITPIRGVNDDNLGKKHALSKLIHTATTEYVWLHDDDVIWLPVLQRSGLRAQWSYSAAVLERSDLVILPLKMESVSNHPSLIEKLQIAEYAAIQELTMRTAKRGHAVMCSGANLIVRREAWLACEPDLHPEIPSGDDMFLLEAMKRRGYKISVIDAPDFTAVVRPALTWRAFFRQRMRWAGKAPKYADKDILRCGALVVAANLLQLLCPPVILIKFPIEYSLIKNRISPPYREGHRVGLFFVALLLELLYPFYLLISLLGGFFRQKKW